MDKITAHTPSLRQWAILMTIAVAVLLAACTPTRLVTGSEASYAPAVRSHTDLSLIHI